MEKKFKIVLIFSPQHLGYKKTQAILQEILDMWVM